MRVSWVGLLFWLAMLCQVIQPVIAISPYNILGVSRTATDSEVEAQYRRLRSKHRRNRARKNMAKQAYSQIMMERRFKSPQEEVPEVETVLQPKHIDQAYVYGYKLHQEFDDGGYFQQHFNETQHIIERLQNSEENKKTARSLLFVGGLFLKLLPCIIIFCLCRNRGRGQASIGDVMARAGAGYANFGRRLRQG